MYILYFICLYSNVITFNRIDQLKFDICAYENVNSDKSSTCKIFPEFDLNIKFTSSYFDIKYKM